MINANANAKVICINDHSSNEFLIEDTSAYADQINTLELTDKPLPSNFTELKIEGCINCKPEGKWNIVSIKK